jgi:predicted urease superfamily metal-dependent hydrolase
VASTFIDDALRRQRVLEERSVNQRLRLVIQYLRDEGGPGMT